MKKIKILCTLFVIICISAQSNANNIGYKVNSAPKVKSTANQQEKSYDAYVLGNGWIKGTVYVTDGIVTRMVFPSGKYNFRIKPTALNPNNPMAIQNNFTHYVDVPNTGRAYFILD